MHDYNWQGSGRSGSHSRYALPLQDCSRQRMKHYRDPAQKYYNDEVLHA